MAHAPVDISWGRLAKFVKTKGRQCFRYFVATGVYASVMVLGEVTRIFAGSKTLDFLDVHERSCDGTPLEQLVHRIREYRIDMVGIL